MMQYHRPVLVEKDRLTIRTNTIEGYWGSADVMQGVVLF
jgi:hypothetical protein